MTSGQVLVGIESKAAVGITSLAEGFTCLGGATLFLWLGDSLEPKLLLPVVTGALLSVPVSARAVRRVPEKALRLAIGLLKVLLGSLALVRSFF